MQQHTLQCSIFIPLSQTHKHIIQLKTEQSLCHKNCSLRHMQTALMLQINQAPFWDDCSKQNLYFTLHLLDADLKFYEVFTDNSVAYKKVVILHLEETYFHWIAEHEAMSDLLWLVTNSQHTAVSANLKCYQEVLATPTCECAGKWSRQHGTRLHTWQKCSCCTVHTCIHSSFTPVLISCW